MADELRVGFLGFGFIGKVHAYGYRTFPFYYPNLPGARFVAVCTSRDESARAAKDAFGFDRATTDFREVTEADDVDVVHIATPNRDHKDALLSAMAAGKHIYCEKPLVASAAEAAEIEAALAGYAGTAQMVLQNRFFPATRRAKELAGSGFLGDVLAFRAAYLHAGSANPDAPLKWKLSKDAAGGGVLFDLGAHIIDLTTHLVGDFAEVDCRTKVAFADRPALDGSGRVPVEAEDHAVVTARTARGALGTVEATKIATGSLDEVRFEIHGTRGAMRFNGMRPNWLEVYSVDDADEGGWRSLDTANQFPPPAPTFPGPKFSVGWIRSHVACLANFIDAVVSGAPAEPSLARGIQLQRVMDACYRSDREGKVTSCQ
jgi:levoglucosan dehydrogenase